MIVRSIIVIVAIVALFAGHIAAFAGDPSSSFITNAPFNTTPPHLVYLGEDQKLIFDIAPDGKITLGDGVSADKVSEAFWTAVQQMGLKLTTNCVTK